MLVRPTVSFVTRAACAMRAAPCASVIVPTVSARCASSSSGIPAQLNTKRPDYLLKFQKASTVKEVYHFTSYALAAGVPLSLLMGSTIAFPLNLAMGVLIPLHAHIGARSVIVDYVHDVIMQRMALAVLAGVTVLTACGLTKLNLTDVGISGTVQAIFKKQPPPPAPKGSSASSLL